MWWVTDQQRWIFMRGLEGRPALVRWFGGHAVRFYLKVRVRERQSPARRVNQGA